VSSSRLKSLMENRRAIRMSTLLTKSRGVTGDIDGDWVTMAVITSKGEPKVSAKVRFIALREIEFNSFFNYICLRRDFTSLNVYLIIKFKYFTEKHTHACNQWNGFYNCLFGHCSLL